MCLADITVFFIDRFPRVQLTAAFGCCMFRRIWIRFKARRCGAIFGLSHIGIQSNVV